MTDSLSANETSRVGPLRGVRVVEVAGIGPGPFCAMLLADLGADVVRVDRPNGPAAGNPMRPELDLMNRGRRSIVLDLKQPAGLDALLRLVDDADALVEGFRPGVAERLGFGPDTCATRNPRLVFGRMTGWGQDGPAAPRAGHDINYIALSGALAPIGETGGPPTVPLNLVGDFGGGGLLLAFGLVCAILEARESGRGQVVDAAIVDGAALLTTALHGMFAQHLWSARRGANLLDGGAYFYGVYACADGGYVSVGAIEPQFHTRLLDLLGLADDPEFVVGQQDPSLWPHLRTRLADLFATRTRAEWTDLLGGEDTCFAPVLSPTEAPDHPHNRARGTFAEVAGIAQPAPAPRFSRSGENPPARPPLPGQHTRELLAEAGLTDGQVAALLADGAAS